MTTFYGLGIDAGGTYTDAALVDFETGKVVVSAKANTTQPDPTGGIRNALLRLDPALLAHVNMVSLATTFATNAIVEDRGAEAGLVLIGYDRRPPEIPHFTRVVSLPGGHTVTGDERESLDLSLLEAGLSGFVGHVQAVAVAGFFSVRNPEHEMAAAHLIRERTGLPVVQGHRLSMRLDATKRAITAWWNARLIPLISNLIQATIAVLSEQGITAPLMVVKGDGTLISAVTALERPVETLLSGPAASILGARHLANVENALIVDMGGTTTDMAALVGGRVALDQQGARVGKWKTHVEAAKVRTIGLGGDSLISSDMGKTVTVGPRRVIPLCVLADRFPKVVETLRAIQTLGGRSGLRSVNPCSFYLPVEGARSCGVTLPDYFKGAPVSELLLVQQDEHRWSTWDLERYEKLGLVVRAALTPTDIRVAQGRFALGDPEAARLGLAIFARHLRVAESACAEVVEEEIRRRLCLEAVSFVARDDEEPLAKLLPRWFPEARPEAGAVDVGVSLKLTAPVIGVGAPAPACLPAAYRRLNTECLLPEGYDVSVAVGAVVGMVDVTARGHIRPTETGQFSLHTSSGRETLDEHDETVTRALAVLTAEVRGLMTQNGVAAPLLSESVEEKRLTTGHGVEVYLETLVAVRGTGRPNVSK